MSEQNKERPVCAIKGFMRHPSGAMGICGYVIVGNKYCGFDGDCPHKMKADEPEKEGDSHE